jgi:hypothetical protein
MSPRYATETAVPVDKTRNEIERTLMRYGAEAFGYMNEAFQVKLAFRMGGRHIRFILPMPDPKDFSRTPTGQERANDARQRAWEQAQRQRWRALLLIIKAKLEAVAAGITTIEDEFLAHTVLPDGSTVGEWAKPQLAIAYERGAMPTHLLLEGPAKGRPA